MTGLLLLLGGSGTRFGSPLPKQFLNYQGRALFAQTTVALLDLLPVSCVVFAVNSLFISLEAFQRPLAELRQFYPETSFEVVPGGATRHLSFRAAFALLQARHPEVEKILVHDANRPFLTKEFIHRIKDELQLLTPEVPCRIPGLPMAESICRSIEGRVVRYENREEIFRVQTPQLLWVAAVKEALQGEAAGYTYWTDEGSFILAAGKKVAVFEGDFPNIKITYPGDLPLENIFPEKVKE